MQYYFKGGIDGVAKESVESVIPPLYPATMTFQTGYSDIQTYTDCIQTQRHTNLTLSNYYLFYASLTYVSLMEIVVTHTHAHTHLSGGCVAWGWLTLSCSIP